MCARSYDERSRAVNRPTLDDLLDYLNSAQISLSRVILAYDDLAYPYTSTAQWPFLIPKCSMAVCDLRHP